MNAVPSNQPAEKLSLFRSCPANPQRHCWKKFPDSDFPAIFMRFLMLNWRDPRNPISGGAERVSLAYLKELKRRGHEVCWFANDFPGGSREEMFEGIKFVRGGGRGSSVL